MREHSKKGMTMKIRVVKGPLFEKKIREARQHLN